jgi:hypothetical protein
LENKLEMSPDQKQTRIVESLAAQCHIPVSEMKTLYEAERARLAVGAYITKFLDVFTTRHVLEALRLRAAVTPDQTSTQLEGSRA